MKTTEMLGNCVNSSQDRKELWSRFVELSGAEALAEIGVWEGQFAGYVLARCPKITRYYMVDPWRHLGKWNKPGNKSDEEFEKILGSAMAATDAWRGKREILRGTTTEVLGGVPDGSLDFAYVDGDHTLRGIAIDLIGIWSKLKPGGYLAGDDFCRSIWQHSAAFEPTLVFPFAVYFAEAHGAKIWGLPFDQYLIQKPFPGADPGGFEFVDLTAIYSDTGLQSQMASMWKMTAYHGTRGILSKSATIKRISKWMFGAFRNTKRR